MFEILETRRIFLLLRVCPRSSPGEWPGLGWLGHSFFGNTRSYELLRDSGCLTMHLLPASCVRIGGTCGLGLASVICEAVRWCGGSGTAERYWFVFDILETRRTCLGGLPNEFSRRVVRFCVDRATLVYDFEFPGA